MGATRHHGVALLAGATDDDNNERVEFSEDEATRGAQLQRECRVNDITTGETEVEVAPLGADRLGNGVHEGERVVIERRLELRDACEVHFGARSDRLRRSGGDVAALRLRLGDGDLHTKCRLPAGSLTPDGSHLWTCVALNHLVLLRRVLSCGASVARRVQSSAFARVQQRGGQSAHRQAPLVP